MALELKDFQITAVNQLTVNIDKAIRNYKESGQLTAIPFTSVTGSGKTIMTGEVIKNLLSRDDKPIIVWMTDAPELGKQTAYSFVNNTGISNGDIEYIDTGTTLNRLEPGKIYILNYQKLAESGSLLQASEGSRPFYDVYSDAIEANATIEDGSVISSDGHPVILFIDEAHIGMKSNADEHRSIYSKLIDGVDARHLPTPVVVGVSATISRFKNYMMRPNKKGKKGSSDISRRVRQVAGYEVEVNAEEVIKTGLIKSLIDVTYASDRSLLWNEGAGIVNGDDWLLSSAVMDYVNKSKAWREATNGDVVPLMLVQIENKLDTPTIIRIADDILEQCHDLDFNLSYDNIRHVMGDGGDIFLNKDSDKVIRKIAPSDVSNDDSVRILFCKTAIIDGWDCPRCEVMYSRRPAEDKDSIAQMLGRSLRNPQVDTYHNHQIQHDDILDSASFYLSRFNKEATNEVIESLTGATGYPAENVKTNVITLQSRVDTNTYERTTLLGEGMDGFSDVKAICSNVMTAWRCLPMGGLKTVRNDDESNMPIALIAVNNLLLLNSTGKVPDGAVNLNKLLAISINKFMIDVLSNLNGDYDEYWESVSNKLYPTMHKTRIDMASNTVINKTERSATPRSYDKLEAMKDRCSLASKKSGKAGNRIMRLLDRAIDRNIGNDTVNSKVTELRESVNADNSFRDACIIALSDSMTSKKSVVSNAFNNALAGADKHSMWNQALYGGWTDQARALADNYVEGFVLNPSENMVPGVHDIKFDTGLEIPRAYKNRAADDGKRIPKSKLSDSTVKNYYLLFKKKNRAKVFVKYEPVIPDIRFDSEWEADTAAWMKSNDNTFVTAVRNGSIGNSWFHFDYKYLKPSGKEYEIATVYPDFIYFVKKFDKDGKLSGLKALVVDPHNGDNYDANKGGWRERLLGICHYLDRVSNEYPDTFSGFREVFRCSLKDGNRTMDKYVWLDLNNVTVRDWVRNQLKSHTDSVYTMQQLFIDALESDELSATMKGTFDPTQKADKRKKSK